MLEEGSEEQDSTPLPPSLLELGMMFAQFCTPPAVAPGAKLDTQ